MNILEFRLKHKDREQTLVVDNVTGREVKRIKRELANSNIDKIVVNFTEGSHAIIDKASIEEFKFEYIN